MSPSSDPLSFFEAEHPLKREHFCVPDFIVWYPEAQYRPLYKDNRPACKFHGCTDCVIRKGWVYSPRHCYGKKRVVALLGRFYICSVRRKERTSPYSFRGYDSQVINTSHDYIKTQWEKTGFFIKPRRDIN